MHKAYIGLGSNLADPALQLKTAITSLSLLSKESIQCSSIYQSSPMTSLNESEESTETTQSDYLNAVVLLHTSLKAINLLDALQQIETAQGRVRSEQQWAARTLDLDLLLFDDEIIDHPRLAVPHYGIKQRNFVIYPLAELDANLVLPDGTTIKALYQSCSNDGIRKIE